MILLIISLGALAYTIVVFGAGYFLGVGAVMRQLPAHTRETLAARRVRDHYRPPT